MDAANPLCRSLMLGVGLLVLAAGCQTAQDAPDYAAPFQTGSLKDQRARNESTYLASNPGAKPTTARPQMPEESPRPVGPIVPIPPNAPLPPSPLAPIAPPLTPPPGVVPAAPTGAVAGSPVSPGDRGEVMKAGYTGVKRVAGAAELLKSGLPRVKVVAVVGQSNLITEQEVVEAVRQRLGEFHALEGPARAAKEKEMFAAELRKTIERELILDDMYGKLKKNGKMAVVEEIKEIAGQAADRHLREIRKHFGVKSADEFESILKSQGLTPPVIRRQLERQFMADQYLSSLLKEKAHRAGLSEIRDYYDAHPDEFKAPDRVKWRHLFVSLAKHPSAQAAYDHAEAVRKKAADGGDFAALVKQHDEGFAKMQNGFGTGEKRGEILPTDIEPTVWSLKPGQMSEVIQTPTGYHVVKVVERDYAGVRPFDQKVQGEIRDKLNLKWREGEYKKLVEELWRKGVVRVFEE